MENICNCQTASTSALDLCQEAGAKVFLIILPSPVHKLNFNFRNDVANGLNITQF